METKAVTTLLLSRYINLCARAATSTVKVLLLSPLYQGLLGSRVDTQLPSPQSQYGHRLHSRPVECPCQNLLLLSVLLYQLVSRNCHFQLSRVKVLLLSILKLPLLGTSGEQSRYPAPSPSV